MPGQLVLQFTDRCNARCPQCGMRVSADFSRSVLAVDEGKRIIDHAASQGFSAISFTGGEPLLYPVELAELIRHAGAAGIRYTRTGTNGYFFTGSDRPGFLDRVARMADILADTPLYTFWISIDSADPRLHEAMRGLTGVIDGIGRGLPLFHERGIHPSANMGINRNVGGAYPAEADSSPDLFLAHFRDGFSRFFRLVSDLGFTIVNACYPMGGGEEEGAVYGAASADRCVSFSRDERVSLYRSFLESVTAFRGGIRIFTPRSSLRALIKGYEEGEDATAPCRGGIDFFFVDAAQKKSWPCGFRGNEDMGEFTSLDVRGIREEADCRRCDWECFRDPSELFAPLLALRSSPLALARRLRNDREGMRLWLDDLNYYRACGFFDARRPFDRKRLLRFRPAERAAD